MPDRPKLEAVVFDVGGTLVRLDFEWMSEVVRGLGHPLEAETLRRAEVAGRRSYDAHRAGAEAPPPPPGVVGWWAAEMMPYFGATIAAAGVPEALRAPALTAWFTRAREGRLWGRPAEGARAALDGLHAMGLRLASVSNSDGRAEEHLVECALREGLEFVVDSHVVGVEKPDPRIFRIALERLEVPAAHAMYVGDLRSVDADGARGAGMHPVLLDPYGDYADGVPAVRDIGRLPAWIQEQFAVARRQAIVPPA